MQPIYQFIKHLLKHEKDLQIDSGHMMVISPDEGGMGRAVFFANVLGLDLGMFYKQPRLHKDHQWPQSHRGP